MSLEMNPAIFNCLHHLNDDSRCSKCDLIIFEIGDLNCELTPVYIRHLLRTNKILTPGKKL